MARLRTLAADLWQRVRSATRSAFVWARRRLRFWDWKVWKSLFALLSKETKAGEDWERVAVRIFVPLAFAVSVVGSILIAHRTSEAPAVAFRNHLLFATELVLLGFYLLLLLLVPVLKAVFAGELPIELTTKGPRYAERAAIEGSQAANQEIADRVTVLRGALDELEETVRESADDAATGLEDVIRDVAVLKEKAQP